MGKFLVKKSEAGVWFNLLATNGQVIGTSEVYKSDASCQGGIESVRKCCVGEVEDQTVADYTQLKHPKFEVYTDKAGAFRFRLKARNGENILASEAYSAKRDCLAGVESVKKNAPDAEVTYA